MRGTTVVLAEPGRIDYQEYEAVAPPPGGILMRMVRANVCGSEIHILKGHHPLVRPGCVLGHEGVGVVEALGDGVDSDFTGAPLAVGNRIVTTYFQACRRCPECNNDTPHICRNAYTLWGTPAVEAPHFNGTFGTFCAIGPNQAVFKVPDSVTSTAVSSANCALSQVYFGCELGEVSLGQKVVVLGAGGLGVCASAVASRMGAEVFVAEMAPARLDKALEFGAHHGIDLSQAEDSAGRVELIREATAGSADVVIDLTGVPDGFTEAVRSTRAGGIMVSIGNISPNRFTEFDPGLFTRSGAQIRAAIRYPGATLGRAVRFIADTPELDWGHLVDKDFAFDDIGSALEAAESRAVTRAGIVIDPSL